jgi:DNA-binding NarL/FixJ family response regulator
VLVANLAASPRLVDLAAARELYRKARFSEADALLESAEQTKQIDPDAALLRMRVLLYREPARVLVYAMEHAKALKTKSFRAETRLLQGASYARLSDFASAESHLKAALTLAETDPAIAAEVRYQQAAVAWMRRKLDIAWRILDGPDIDQAPERVQVQRFVLQGAVAASRGDMVQQGAILLEALAFVQKTKNPSVLPWAVAASQVCYLARELYSPALRESAYAQISAVPWTKDLDPLHFTALRAVGWCHALEGDYFNAFRRLKDAALVAESPAWRVMSLCDRSYLARSLGENRWAEQERNDARELASSIDWRTLDGEERFALCLLAELFAEHDGPRAFAQIAEYHKSGKNFAPILASADDRRVTALEAYSSGVVQWALGEVEEAARLLTLSYEIYSAVQYRWRAGRAALALANITGAAEWQERAGKLLSVYPRSWLVNVNGAERVEELPGVSELTAAQRTVYDLLMLGLSASEIAQRLERSQFTVRNHVKAIFKTLNVRSRATLLARAARGAV